MAKLTVTGLGALDGEYEFDESRFSNSDLHTIKVISGVRAGELMEAMEAGDNDVLVAMGKIVLERNGKRVSTETLMAAEIGRLEFDWGVQEADADVPPPVAVPEKQPGDSNSSSGSSSDPSGDTSPSLPKAIGLAG